MVYKVGQFQIFSSECLRQSGNINECEMRVLFEINIFLSLFNIVYTLFSERDKLDIAYLFSIQNGDGRNWWTENSIRFLGLLGHWKKKYRIRAINLVVYIVLKKSKQEIIKIILVKILQALMIVYVLIEMLRFMYFKSGFFSKTPFQLYFRLLDPKANIFIQAYHILIPWSVLFRLFSKFTL